MKLFCTTLVYPAIVLQLQKVLIKDSLLKRGFHCIPECSQTTQPELWSFCDTAFVRIPFFSINKTMRGFAGATEILAQNKM